MSASLHDWPYLVAAIAGMTLTTVATRTSFYMLPSRFELPPRIERALRYAPACALAAIIAQGVFTKAHRPDISIGNHHMWALAAAWLVSTRTKNMIVIMTVGMAVFTALRLWV
jgi:branched-subunit amino acid transport protein